MSSNNLIFSNILSKVNSKAAQSGGKYDYMIGVRKQSLGIKLRNGEITQEEYNRGIAKVTREVELLNSGKITIEDLYGKPKGGVVRIKTDQDVTNRKQFRGVPPRGFHGKGIRRGDRNDTKRGITEDRNKERRRGDRRRGDRKDSNSSSSNGPAGYETW